MNQDQVIEQLLRIEKKVEDFVLTFSGKISSKIDGLYMPDQKEIIIHNKNFKSDNAIMYTAIHEFAHHIQFTTSPLPVSARAHGSKFWDIFHNLLLKAEQKGVYRNAFSEHNDFIFMTGKIKENYLIKDAKLMKEFGGLLLEAFVLCQEKEVSFDDYMDRGLQLHRTSAKSIMNVFVKDVKPAIGFENMKTVARIKDDDIRSLAFDAFSEGKSPDMVKAAYCRNPGPDGALEALMKEKERIERGLDRLTTELVKVERRISEVGE